MNTIKTKNIVIGLLVLLMYSPLQAQGIDFKTDSWQAVKNRAKKDNKLIFVDAYTTWCGPCKIMDKNVFSNQKVGAFYNDHFISFKIDTEKGAGPDFAKEQHISSYPTYLFMDGDGKLLLRKTGAMPAEAFLQIGQKVLDLDKAVATMASAYENGNRDPEFILKYLASLKERDLPTQDMALWYFAMIGQENWGSQKNQILIRAYIQNPYSSVIQFLEKHKEPEAMATKQSFTVYNTLNTVYKDYIKKTLVPNKKDQEIDQILSKTEALFYPREAAYIHFLVKKEIAKRDKDWESYTKNAMDYVNNHQLPAKRYTSVNNMAMVFYNSKHINDKTALSEALKWMDVVLKNTKDSPYYPGYLDTQARVLYKLGRKKEALKLANKIVKMAEKTGDNPSETLALIEEIKTN